MRWFPYYIDHRPGFPLASCKLSAIHVSELSTSINKLYNPNQSNASKKPKFTWGSWFFCITNQKILLYCAKPDDSPLKKPFYKDIDLLQTILNDKSVIADEYMLHPIFAHDTISIDNLDTIRAFFDEDTRKLLQFNLNSTSAYHQCYILPVLQVDACKSVTFSIINDDEGLSKYRRFSKQKGLLSSELSHEFLKSNFTGLPCIVGALFKVFFGDELIHFKCVNVSGALDREDLVPVINDTTSLTLDLYIHKESSKNRAFPLSYQQVKSAIEMAITSTVNKLNLFLVNQPTGGDCLSLIRSIAIEHSLPIRTLHPCNLFSDDMKQSQEKLLQAFLEVRSMIRTCCPAAVIFVIEDLDLLCNEKRVDGKSDSKLNLPLSTSFLTELENLMSFCQQHHYLYLFVGITESLANIDHRIKKFMDRGTINLPTLTNDDRYNILLQNLPSSPESNLCLRKVSEQLAGVSLAQTELFIRDLSLRNVHGNALSIDAVLDCLKKSLGSLIRYKTFDRSMLMVEDDQQENNVNNLDLNINRKMDDKWSAVGGYEEVKLSLKQSIEWPILYPDTCKRLGLTPCHGILLHGPPGNSKTTLARIAANSIGVHFLSLNGAELYSCYLGESEKLLRDTFKKARSLAPCILFLDEIDSLLGSRSIGNNMSDRGSSGSSGGGGSGPANKDVVQERVLSTILNEMDGIESLHGLIIIGATNRIDKLDDALLRPGRFDKLIYVGPPDLPTRRSILSLHVNKLPVHSDQLEHILNSMAELTDGFSGADCVRVVQEAAMVRLRREFINESKADSSKAASASDFKNLFVDIEDFIAAIDICKYQ